MSEMFVGVPHIVSPALFAWLLQQGPGCLGDEVARVVVSRGQNTLRAAYYDEAGRLLGSVRAPHSALHQMPADLPEWGEIVKEDRSC